MPSNEQDLQVVLQAQQKRDMAENITSVVVSEMKISLLFQMNWEELLQSAPTALSCMGACFIASSSPRATVHLKPMPDKPFKYLRYTSIQANLVECGNLGRFAFLEAEKGMGTIQLTSKLINNKINMILQCLGEPESAKKLLKPQLNAVKNSADLCLRSAKAMDEKFALWLNYACEMHAACTQEEQSTSDQLFANAAQLAIAETQLDSQKLAVEEAKKTQELMGKQTRLASKAFKQASDQFPSGWDLIGQQFVQDLASAATTALNQVLNPLSMVTGIFGAQTGHGKTDAQPQPTPKPVPQKLQDPAYGEIIKAATFLTTLDLIISGKNSKGDIDWEAARGDGSAEKNSNIMFLSAMLNDAQQHLAAVATTDDPSVKLTDVFKTCVKISDEIKAEVEKSTNPSARYPAKDSAQVKRWQSDFAQKYNIATQLLAIARNLPGTPANGIPLMAEPTDTSSINAKSTHAQAVLESAKNRLATTQQMLATSQENYIKATDMLLQQQNKLGEIQSNLKRLTESNLSLTEIKNILIECIKLIVSLKQQVTNLVRFFQAMSSTIEIVIEFHVVPFLETIAESVAADGTDPLKVLKIGNYTLTDLQRSMVFSAALTLRSYFSVFGEVARMWVTLSKENIMPGLALCDHLSLTTENPVEMQKKLAALNTWSATATKQIRDIAYNKQQEIMSGMEERIKEVAETQNLITPLPKETVLAITSGTTEAKTVMQQSITTRATSSGLTRFTQALSDDD